MHANHSDRRIFLFFSFSLLSSVWDMYERVFVASLDAHDYPVATWCLSTLDSQWPGSSRVARLKGMNSEARGHYSSAADLYTEFLADEPTNIGMLRRQVACAKGAGDLAGAITLLNKYVKIYSSDENAWLELSELYVQSSQIDLASFALEELIMLAPENYVYHLKYADLQYTLGAYDIARQYYAQSLELKPKNNLRALYGLVLSLKTKSGAANAPNPQGLYTWTAEQIIAHYNKYQPSLVDIAKATITGEGNNPTITSHSTSSPLPSPSAATAATTSSAHSQEEPREVQPTELPD